MLQTVIDTLVIGAPPSPSVIVLRPLNDKDAATERVLPIWIGPSEAASIGMALEGSPHVRPMTHDLFTALLQTTGTSLNKVVINRVEGTTFFATLVLTQDGVVKNLDARPSDSIALAVREHVPIFVEEQVLDLASFPAALSPTHNEEAEAEAFHEFIETVNPEDFKEAH